MLYLLACLAGAALCGCGGKAEITKQDQNNFQGGPQPPGYAAEAAKRKATKRRRIRRRAI